jgi:mRNA-degrading endonuclease RelE of RelBE toxin-antitoxin system
LRYDVYWLPSAEEELTRLWLDPLSRRKITEATEEVDRLLRINPSELGESRDGDLRVMFVDPLGVSFIVDENQTAVVVVEMWRYRRDDRQS